MGDVVERLTLEEVVKRAESEFYREPTRAAHSLPAHIATAVRSFLLSEERVEATSEAITADLARQDGSEGTWILDHGKLAFIDQNDVDMRSLARAALTAAIGEGK